MLTWLYFATSVALGLSLLLPRLWLHVVGVAGCSILLVHAVEMRDPSFIVLQMIFVFTNAMGLAHCAWIRYGRNR